MKLKGEYRRVNSNQDRNNRLEAKESKNMEGK
jgi:hypothetical protein